MHADWLTAAQYADEPQKGLCIKLSYFDFCCHSTCIHQILRQKYFLSSAVKWFGNQASSRKGSMFTQNQSALPSNIASTSPGSWETSFGWCTEDSSWGILMPSVRLWKKQTLKKLGIPSSKFLLNSLKVNNTHLRPQLGFLPGQRVCGKSDFIHSTVRYPSWRASCLHCPFRLSRNFSADWWNVNPGVWPFISL